MKGQFKTENGKWDLEKIARKCQSELKKIKIPIQTIIRVYVTRDKYTYGRVDQNYYDETWFDLYISNTYRSPKYELDEVKTVICHLLLHTVKDCMNHGEKWMDYASKIDREYGLHIIEHAASRPKAGVHWGSAVNAVASSVGNCCVLDYLDMLKELMNECSKQLTNIGLPLGNVSKVLFSRDDSAYGRCWKNEDKSYTIHISNKYARADADGVGLRNLIAHELLHTCPDDDTIPNGIHGPRWREMARKADRELGYKIMSQSHSDAIKKTSGMPITRYVCPVCGGFYDVYEEKDKRKEIHCTWCHHKMNAISEDDMGILDALYIWFGECQDKLRIAEIPIGIISGIGFVSEDRQTGLHDNWNRTFSIDIPEIYRQQEVLGDGIKVYLCRELLKTCERIGDAGRWEEYCQKASEVLGLSI